MNKRDPHAEPVNLTDLERPPFLQRWEADPASTALIEESSWWQALSSRLDHDEVRLATAKGWFTSSQPDQWQRYRFFATDRALYCCPLQTDDNFDVRAGAPDLAIPFHETFIFELVSESFDFDLVMSASGRPADAIWLRFRFDTTDDGLAFAGTLIAALQRHGGGTAKDDDQPTHARSADTPESQPSSRRGALAEDADALCQLTDQLRRFDVIDSSEAVATFSFEANPPTALTNPLDRRYLWILTNQALHIVKMRLGEVDGSKFRLDLKDPDWTVHLDSGGSKLVAALVKRAGETVRWAQLPAVGERAGFISNLERLSEQRHSNDGV